MSINQVYHSCLQQLRQLYPSQRISRLRSFATLMNGIFQAKSVQVPKIANEIPARAKERSITRRLERGLDNRALRVRELYRPLAQAWLLSQARATGQIRLILDTTKVSFSHQLLMVGVACGRRAIPIAWTWLRCAQGHSSAKLQLARLAYVRSLLPDSVPVLLVGESAVEAAALQEPLEGWGWCYVVRPNPNTLLKQAEQHDWQAFGSLLSAMGHRV